MLKVIAAAALTAFIIYDVTIAPGYTAMVENSGPQRSIKGDRLPIGPACSEAAWPHYESKCVRSRTTPPIEFEPMRQVRIVSTDRLPNAQRANRCDCH